MATEEIEISELEFTEELASDNLIPVEGLTDTKATSLQKLRDWLGIESAILKQMPTGLILPYGGSTAPEGFLICDGSAISRTTYARLFETIGAIWGAGDGSTTFNLPNLIDKRYIQGFSSSGNYIEESLPNIKGRVGNVRSSGGTETSYSGALYPSNPTEYPNQSSKQTNFEYYSSVNIDASLYSSIYKDGAIVQPKSAQMIFIIKY